MAPPPPLPLPPPVSPEEDPVAARVEAWRRTARSPAEGSRRGSLESLEKHPRASRFVCEEREGSDVGSWASMHSAGVQAVERPPPPVPRTVETGAGSQVSRLNLAPGRPRPQASQRRRFDSVVRVRICPRKLPELSWPPQQSGRAGWEAEECEPCLCSAHSHAPALVASPNCSHAE
jgi:hypothetical protein